MIRLRSLHPYLVAAYPSLALFVHNIGQVGFTEVWPILVGVIITTLALRLLLRFLFEDSDKASILLSIGLLFFFSFGHVHSALAHCQIGPINMSLNRNLFILWMALIVFLSILIIRTRRSLAVISVYLTTVFALLVIFSLYNIAIYKIRSWDSHRGIPALVENLEPPNQLPAQTLPDIYYIILDRYGSELCLQQGYNFDNSPFLSWLTEQGFYVAKNSLANYPITSHSLASSLNMEYINYLGDQPKLRPNDWMPLYNRLADFRLWHLLKELGYQYIHVGPGWHPTSRNRAADRNIYHHFLPEFPRMLCQTTMLAPLLSRTGLHNPLREKYDRVVSQFSRLASIPDQSGPTFVFAHFLLPHQPYVVDRNGHFLPQAAAFKRSTETKYLDQVRYVNRELQELVTGIIDQSGQSAIIILQGDEGPYPHDISEKTFSFTQASDEQLLRKMSILNALYMPEADQAVFHSHLSPVNTFRIMFNEYFGTAYKILPDSSYVFPDRQNLYNFTNVSEKLRALMPD